MQNSLNPLLWKEDWLDVASNQKTKPLKTEKIEEQVVVYPTLGEYFDESCGGGCE